MNVALVVHNFDRGEGTGGYAVHLAEQFAPGHAVTVYARGVRASVATGIEVVRVPALGGRAYATVMTFPTGFRWVRRRHDVIHAQGWVASHADVVTAHIVLAAWRDAARKARIAPPLGERWLGGYVEHRERRLIGGARAVIAPSQKAAREIGQWYGRDEGVHVIPHAFPPAPTLMPREEARNALHLPRDAFIALYVGDARKGLEPALRGVAAVPDIHLAVASHSDPAPYLARARSLDITTRLHWLGAQSDPVVPYSAVDVLVHPTIYDSFGLVVAEAMACGLPVVVTPLAGVAELMTPNVSGVILRTDEDEEIAHTLTDLAGNPDRAARMGEEAQTLAASRTWADVAEETMTVYEQLP
jgi:UDP-glucose:(heptosyl)LPS alpha-1,3-glucosyltransferase